MVNEGVKKKPLTQKVAGVPLSYLRGGKRGEGVREVREGAQPSCSGLCFLHCTHYCLFFLSLLFGAYCGL